MLCAELNPRNWSTRIHNNILQAKYYSVISSFLGFQCFLNFDGKRSKYKSRFHDQDTTPHNLSTRKTLLQKNVCLGFSDLLCFSGVQPKNMIIFEFRALKLFEKEISNFA